MISSIRRGHAISSRFRSRISRLASSTVTGAATSAIRAAVARLCRGVASISRCLLVKVGVRAWRSHSLGNATLATFPRVGLFAEACLPEPGRRHGRVARGPCGPAIAATTERVSPAGRWRSRRSPPLALKFRVSLGLRHQFSLGLRCESPSPVPRNCRCAPGAPRYNAAHPDRLVARKRHTQRRRPHGPPSLFLPMLLPPAPQSGYRG